MQFREQKRDVRIAKRLTGTHVGANAVSLGAAGRHSVEILAMLPSTIHVARGATVTFSMPRRTGETHTATFGPKAYLKPISDSFQGSPVFDPRAIWSSSPPGSIVEAPKVHGNGFANTGVLDQDSGTPLPPGQKITFTRKGVYHFECLIHTFMKGTVIVQ